MDDEVFTGYIERLYQYLQVVEQRLFSEGLHTLGQEPTGAQVCGSRQAMVLCSRALSFVWGPISDPGARGGGCGSV